MEDDSPEALKRELARAGQLVTELEQEVVYADRDRARLSDELARVRNYAATLELARQQRDKFESELRQIRHHWAMYYLDRSPIDLRLRPWPPEVSALCEAFEEHPIGTCDRCRKVAPLKDVNGENLCAWLEGCDDEPPATPPVEVESPS